MIYKLVEVFYSIYLILIHLLYNMTLFLVELR